MSSAKQIASQIVSARMQNVPAAFTQGLSEWLESGSLRALELLKHGIPSVVEYKLFEGRERLSMDYALGQGMLEITDLSPSSRSSSAYPQKTVAEDLAEFMAEECFPRSHKLAAAMAHLMGLAITATLRKVEGGLEIMAADKVSKLPKDARKWDLDRAFELGPRLDGQERLALSSW